MNGNNYRFVSSQNDSLYSTQVKNLYNILNSDLAQEYSQKEFQLSSELDDFGIDTSKLSPGTLERLVRHINN